MYVPKYNNSSPITLMYTICSDVDLNPKFNTDSGFGSKGTKMIIFKSEPKPKNVILVLSILHVYIIKKLLKIG